MENESGTGEVRANRATTLQQEKTLSGWTGIIVRSKLIVGGGREEWRWRRVWST